MIFPLLLAAALTFGPVASETAETSTDVITADNLLSWEQYWPYRVTMIGAPDGSRPEQGLPRGRGVLIRVEEGGIARVDFGRDGLHRVPIPQTDLVEQANRIRAAELAKTIPNFILALGTRLMDAGAQPPAAVRFDDLTHQRLFLCVFADSSQPEFATLGEALRPVQYPELTTIFFPQSGRSDALVYERLREVGWPVAFVYQHLARAYTRTLIDEGTPMPWLILQTAEGRVLFQGPAARPSLDGLEAVLVKETAKEGGSLPGAERDG